MLEFNEVIMGSCLFVCVFGALALALALSIQVRVRVRAWVRVRVKMVWSLT